MTKKFLCSHSTTIDIGKKIRESGFRPSTESFRVCPGTYFWCEGIELLEILANHWYECKKCWSKDPAYPEKDVIYAVISCDELYIIDFTNDKMRTAFIRFAEKMNEKDIKNKHLVYARMLQDLEKEVASRLNCASFKFKVVLAIETVPSIKDSFVTTQINSAKILIVRDENEELIAIQDSLIDI